LYLALAEDDGSRRAAYRDLFARALEDAPLTELRLALNQDQPIGNARFYREIQAMTGQRRELRKRGRPRKSKDDALGGKGEQGDPPFK
jgi:putative transposase